VQRNVSTENVVNFEFVVPTPKLKNKIEEDELYAMSQSAYKNKQEKQVCKTKRKKTLFALPRIYRYFFIYTTKLLKVTCI
jgi:hypothetical protein